MFSSFLVYLTRLKVQRVQGKSQSSSGEAKCHQRSPNSHSPEEPWVVLSAPSLRRARGGHSQGVFGGIVLP